MQRCLESQTTRECDEVVRRAFEVLGLAKLRETIREPQYCTTNSVFAAGPLVFKRYLHRSAFIIETQILSLRRHFSFRMPEIVLSVDDPVLGCWSVLHRIPGFSLIESLPQGKSQIEIADQMVDALFEFEERVQGLVNMEWTIWTLKSVVKALVKFCSERGAAPAADVLWQAADHWDHLLAVEGRVPCFDLYPRNVIWSASNAHTLVSFVDFDKADRLVPRGEQLSHIAMLPGLEHTIGRETERYAMRAKMEFDEVAEVASVTSFFRALSGVRDSLPWNLLTERTSIDPHADIRRRAFEHSLRQARKHAAAVTGKSASGSLCVDKIIKALDEIAAASVASLKNATDRGQPS